MSSVTTAITTPVSYQTLPKEGEVSKTGIMTRTDKAIHFINRWDELIKNVSDWKLWALVFGIPLRVLWVVPAAITRIFQACCAHTIEIGDTYREHRVATWGGWGPTIKYMENYTITKSVQEPIQEIVFRTARVTEEWTERMLGDEARNDWRYN